MTTPSFDLAAQLHRHGGALRQLAGELLRDPTAADDAVQEVWLAALRRPPVHQDSVGGWLRTALHNVARRLGRGERRRERRERSHLAGTPRVAEAASVEVERSEVAHRLLAAVDALPAVYRDAIWQRYFEGRAPREIAALSGESITTVKSRLQRGLGCLREQLGKDGKQDGDWRAALGLTFGIGKQTVAVAGIGGVLMATWMKVTAALVVAGVLAAWWWVPRAESTISSMPVAGGAECQAVLATAAGTKATEAASQTTAAAERVDAAPSIAKRDPGLASLHGRCVDALGAPLARCKVWLHAWARDNDEQRLWELDHGAMDWKDPAIVTTGADGRFGFEFEPRSPLQFLCDVSGDGRQTMNARWMRFEAGTSIDAGDLVMLAGALLRGCVVDENGKPVANVGVHFDAVDTPKFAMGVFAARREAQVGSGQDGRFSSHHPLPPGAYEVRLDGHAFELRSAKSIEVPAGVADAELTIVVAAGPVLPTITGKVVDASGAPIAGASVTCITAHRGLGDPVRTRKDGSFEVRAEDVGERDAARFQIGAIGFEPGEPADAVPWGSRDVTFALTAASDLQVRVLDSNEQPLLDYAVRLLPHLSARVTSDDPKIRAQGHAPNGVMLVRGVTRGSYDLMVEFPSASGLEPVFQLLDYRGGAQQAVVHVPAPATRSLRVVRADGTPVVGTHVQLVELLGNELTDFTRVEPRGRWFQSTNRRLLMLSTLTTDAEGRCRLQGPSNHMLGLRILGPGHAPYMDSRVRLDVPDELVVRVTQGATLRGRVGPEAALAELERLHAQTTALGFDAAAHRAHLRLRNERTWFPPIAVEATEPAFAAFQLAADGTFVIAGVPPGSWDVEVCYWVVPPMQPSNGPRTMSSTSLPGAHVTVADGDDVAVDLDLQAIVPGHLAAKVLWNGTPLTNAAITLDSSVRNASGTRDGGEWINLRTDAEGCFEYSGRAATYALIAWTGPDDAKLAFPLHAANPAAIMRGQMTSHTFAIESGELHLRLLDARGQPVPDVCCSIVDPEGELPRTDHDGRIAAIVTAGSLSLHVLPKRLQSAAAQQKLADQALTRSRTDALASLWIDLGTATVVAGQTTTLDLHLPGQWDQ